MNDLSRKTLASIARTQAALALMLFVPAWTLAYWQAWLYWTVSTAATLTTALHFLRRDPALMQRRLEVGARAEPLRKQKIIQGIGGLLYAAMFVAAGIDHHLHGAVISVPATLIADAIVAAGFGLTFVVFKANTFTASTVTVEAGQHVVSTGPYAIVRHPMYAASVVWFVATPFALGSRWALVPAALMSLMLAVRLVDEERHLRVSLPGYDAYCETVRWRVIPGLW
ncbi:MAG TPA: isoprenylcysteine carboxylmethyltransferase family protein [Rhodanobacteraceae bacterium]|nr:isoprenylcysteine carboxylmethyltransferase family protein [Rhodanobacteraceae bacterium]